MTRQVPSSTSTFDPATAPQKRFAALALLGLTPPDCPALEAIAANCRDQFLEALRCCSSKTDGDGFHRAYLDNVLACLAPTVPATLASIGLAADPADLVAIAAYLQVAIRIYQGPEFTGKALNQ